MLLTAVRVSCAFLPLHSTEMAPQPLVQAGVSEDSQDDLESVTDHAEEDSDDEVLSTFLSEDAKSDKTVTLLTSSYVTASSPNEEADEERLKEEVQIDKAVRLRGQILDAALVADETKCCTVQGCQSLTRQRWRVEVQWHWHGVQRCKHVAAKVGSELEGPQV